MSTNKDEPPFWYQRGNLKIIGRTDKDRKSMQLDNILYWVCRIIFAVAALIAAIATLRK